MFAHSDVHLGVEEEYLHPGTVHISLLKKWCKEEDILCYVRAHPGLYKSFKPPKLYIHGRVYNQGTHYGES